MAGALTIISSMATRHALAECVTSFKVETGRDVDLVSIGGVDAAKRIRAGEAFDVVVLAMDALQKLAAEGFVAAGSLTVFARSPTAVAVRSGAPRPSKIDPGSIRTLIASARSIGISSGPSGVAIRRLIEGWGLGAEAGPRIVEARPGHPVARLIAGGDADIGFQQLSELTGEAGIDVIATLPKDFVPLTEFAVARLAASRNDEADLLIRHLLSDRAHAALARYGLQSP